MRKPKVRKDHEIEERKSDAVVVENVEPLEEEYFGRHNDMVIPDLLCSYYENQEYELVCYLAKTHYSEFGESRFYYMMSLMEMGFLERAKKLYRSRQDDWFQECRTHRIYWKHVVLFALYFKELRISEEIQEIFDQNYDSPLVRLFEYAVENKPEEVPALPLFHDLCRTYPVLAASWKKGGEKKKKNILSFEDIQWKQWEKENQAIGNGQKFGMENVFTDSDLSIYSFRPKEASAALHILTDGNTVILLDCGSEIEGEEAVRIPVGKILDELEIDHIDAVFISHAHLDHYGSLNEIKKQKVYMTRETYQLIRHISPETFLGTVTFLNEYETRTIDRVAVLFLPNGHICGSVLMDIDWKNKKRIVYTGDFSVEDQKTVDGLKIGELLGKKSKRIDVLLTETTFGKKKDMFRLRQYETMFFSLCQKHLQYGNKIFIPCFAVGRAQEISLLLAQLAKDRGARILIDGKAAGVTELYQSFLGPEKQILNKNINVCHSELEYGERIENCEIILASSGMMKPGSTSSKYITELMNRENVCVMKTGYIYDSEYLLQSVQRRKEGQLHYVELSLSAHAGYEDLIHTIESLSPDHVIYVHGAGISAPGA